ncbi:hypothetical protein H2202_006365 [Exophiala xenobiotica]|nr:hypothetical protein H2202_006365 [Exophiala xenobiotica]KAK5204548.1 hypothetical protein LTR41_009720 [Exophiala xenobiotica]KAK5216817.1 hypothetical protein LTR72_010187 [Exophiala xenobiotica]KAK5286879.1 hypothetical protein LTR14_009624 [Exophiala xenobiotica]KAK5404998.1 hypothetical protein LTR06_009265 [Exophiala xenobiotica]
MRSYFESIVVGGVLAGVVNAVSVQENYTICNWARLRAGVVRDALYLDGGLLWWQTAFADGTTPVVSSDGNVAGDMFRLNFSQPFDTSKTNISALFERMPKAGGAGNNIAPNYVDGTMFFNNDELYLYGGLPPLTDSSSPQSAETVLGYEAYQYGPNRASWSPGFYQGSLPDGVTRYITNGAGVSAPSENLGFYFSGMRAPDWGPIYYEDSSANQTANTLIQVDMSVMRSEKWTNTTLPDNIAPRANAELVWLPVSDQGVLVAIGGVTAPEEIWPAGLNSSQTSTSQAQSPGFMESLPVYDIGSQTWYLQNTTGDAPGQLTEFCSVVAPANDSSSYNIYIYGGYDGLNAGDEPSDDVWILSIPSFTWIKAYSGNSAHGRSGHRCVTPYPDQMFIIGGIHQNQAECVEGGIIQIFNLNTLQFQDTYDPNTWSEYQIPSAVTKAIGGNPQGGATQTATWSDSALGGVFSRKYTQQITQYYPYPSDGSSSSSTSSSGKSGISKGAIIGISVAAVVIGLLLIVLLLLLFRRRRIIHSTMSEKSATSSNSRVTRWLNGASCAPSPHKTQSSSQSGPEVQQVSNLSTEEEQTAPLRPHRHEMAGTERPKPPYELATPYNKDDHPRNSGVVDSGYNADYGHTYSNSNSNSNSNSSGEEYRPSPLTSFNGNAPGGTGNGNGSPLRNMRYPPGSASRFSEDVSTPSQETSSTGTNETMPWPFPSTQNTWRQQQHPHQPQNQNQDRRAPASRYGLGSHGHEGSDSSSVQPIIEEPESPPRELDAGERHGPGERFSYQHTNESASSGIETLPSPNGTLPRDEDQRRSMFQMVSPVSPTMGRRL